MKAADPSRGSLGFSAIGRRQKAGRVLPRGGGAWHFYGHEPEAPRAGRRFRLGRWCRRLRWRCHCHCHLPPRRPRAGSRSQAGIACRAAVDADADADADAARRFGAASPSRSVACAGSRRGRTCTCTSTCTCTCTRTRRDAGRRGHGCDRRSDGRSCSCSANRDVTGSSLGARCREPSRRLARDAQLCRRRRLHPHLPYTV